MLLQFVVENFLSFRDKAVLSMVAAEGVEHREDQVLHVPGFDRPVLKCAAIYGANASGKSNLVKAMQFALDLVRDGRASGEIIGLRPFKLDDESMTKPTRFEFDLHAGGKHYSYGLLASEKRIEAEWLGAVDGKEEVELFERTFDEAHPDKPVIRIGDAMSSDLDRRQFLRFVAEGTRANQLYLTELRERNFDELSSIFTWFGRPVCIGPQFNAYMSDTTDKNEDARSFIAEFLRNVDTGIADIRTTRSPIKASDLPSGVVAALKRRRSSVAPSGESVVTGESLEDFEIVRILLQHQGKGKLASFSVDEESDGTRRLLTLTPVLYVLNDRQESRLFVVDELDHSLHPQLTYAIVRAFLLRAFLESAPEPNQGQLIFTTHDTGLLDPSLLPRDSTWFVEKDHEGASRLYSLAEYKGEELDHLKSIERGYLQGRFGAVPHLRHRLRSAR